MNNRSRMRGEDLTPDYVRERLSYDPDTGAFTWKITVGRAASGKLAGSRTARGYIVISVGDRLYRAHRLAFFVMTGSWPIYGVDHINGIKDDNRWANLRDVPDAINIQNKRRIRADKKNSDLPLGVTRQSSPRKKQFIASLGLNGRTIHLGEFYTKEEAYEAYLTAKRALHEGCTI